MAPYARVAVARPVFPLLHYRVPPHLVPDVRVGVRCVVPLGRTRTSGIVVALDPEPGVARVRDLVDVLDPEPCLPPDLVRLGLWVAGYYQHPPGETLVRMIPAALRPRARAVYQPGPGADGSGLSGIEAALWERACRPPGLDGTGLGRGDREALGRLVSRGLLVRQWRVDAARPIRETWFSLAPGAPEPGAAGRRSPRQAEVLAALSEGPLPAWLLRERGVSPDALRRAVSKGWVLRGERPVSARGPGGRGLAPEAPVLELRPEQARAVSLVREALRGGRFAPVVLQGVTGSGKTEVYLRAADEALALGRGVLLLVPEIALTPQMLGRVVSRFGDRVAVLHSALGDRERALQWERARRGEARLVLGARSAVFAPVPDLGLVVVDEEHDPAYKQEEGVRYHAKHAALVRARDAGAVAILGSATPDVETVWAARSGRYALCTLPARVGEARPPEIRIVDLRQEDRRRGHRVLLSSPLARAVDETLSRGEQVLLFLNRRGFSPVLACSGCGGVVGCPSCSISLTVHRRKGGAVLLCHYCGRREPVPPACPACGVPALYPAGAGTQRLIEAVQARWPEARVLRLDRDAVRSGGGLPVLEAFQRGEADILVGTQMVAKGHHFPRLTLVGVADADGGLHFPDFRASERTFQVLTQVAGRAGREERPGRVLIQTRCPDHPVLRAVAASGFEAFARAELEARRQAGYPPFRRLALVHVSSPDPGRAEQVAARLVGEAAPRAAALGVEVLGPAPAPIERLRGRWRFQAMLRSAGSEPGPLLALLRWLRGRGALTPPPEARIVVDVDPVSVL